MSDQSELPRDRFFVFGSNAFDVLPGLIVDWFSKLPYDDEPNSQARLWGQFELPWRTMQFVAVNLRAERRDGLASMIENGFDRLQLSAEQLRRSCLEHPRADGRSWEDIHKAEGVSETFEHGVPVPVNDAFALAERDYISLLWIVNWADAALRKESGGASTIRINPGCEDIIGALEITGRPMTTGEIHSDLDKIKPTSLGVLKQNLAFLTAAGRLVNPRDGKGYRLPSSVG